MDKEKLHSSCGKLRKDYVYFSTMKLFSLNNHSVDFEQSNADAQWLRKSSIFCLILSSSFLLSGCLSLPTTEVKKPENVSTDNIHEKSEPILAPKQQSKVIEVVDLDLWGRLRQNFALRDIKHSRIQKEIKRLQHSPQSFDILIGRAQPFLHHIIEQVEQRAIPAEIALLPAVESGFRPYAYSRNGAAGLWQFMPATGRSLGLEQDWWYDGRRDVLASTEAALSYLLKLNKRFDGDWLHTLAAYNAGGGTVNRAIRKARKKNQPTDFWNLDLPGETDNYVPRLLALTEIINDPGRYGLALPSFPNHTYFSRVASGGQIDLKVAASLANLPLEDLLQLNPGFSRWSTRPEGPHHLLLPNKSVQRFSLALKNLPDDKRLRWQRHKIKNGDNLGKIARKYNVSISAIKQANQLKDNRIRAGKALMIPLSEAVAMSTPSRKLGIPKSRVRYLVRKGDSLFKIARKFHVKIVDLRRWNKVGRYLKPGQRLTVFVNPSRQTT